MDTTFAENWDPGLFRVCFLFARTMPILQLTVLTFVVVETAIAVGVHHPGWHHGVSGKEAGA